MLATRLPPPEETGRSLRLALASVSMLVLASFFGVSCAKAPPMEPDWSKGSGGASGAGGARVTDGMTPVQRHGQLAVVGTDIVNEHGDVIQLKGPSSMWLNWEGSGYANNAAGVGFMRDDWGAQVIRAAMGIDASGAYLTNPTKAKADVRAVIDNAIALGMYVIIDWHDHNAHMHQDAAAAFFTEMAMEYGDLPNVLYEPFNEPQQVAWATVVKPYHEAVVAAIRAVDPDNIIILGTPTWSQDVDIAANSPVAGTNLMYTLHFYSCTHAQAVRSKGDTARAKGAALFITEWGATNADGGMPAHPELCLEEAQAWHNWMNAKHISWTAWKFDDCADKSCFFLPGAPITGGWTDQQLGGHGPFVRDRMRE